MCFFKRLHNDLRRHVLLHQSCLTAVPADTPGSSAPAGTRHSPLASARHFKHTFYKSVNSYEDVKLSKITFQYEYGILSCRRLKDIISYMDHVHIDLPLYKRKTKFQVVLYFDLYLSLKLV